MNVEDIASLISLIIGIYTVSLHYLEKDEPQKFGLFGHTVYIPIIRLIRLAISSTFINQF